MEDKRFNVVFSGKLAQGVNPQEVLAKLCSLLKQEQPQVRDLFKGGNGAVVLKDIGVKEAYDMRDALREAGAICTVQEIIPPPAAEAPPFNQRPMEPPPPPSRSPRQQPPDLRPLRPAPSVQAASGPGIGSLIFKVLVLAALAGGGWWGYQNYFAPPSPAFQAYAQFAEALAREQYQKAADASLGQARGHVDLLTQMMAPTTMKLYGKEFSMGKPSISSIAGEIAWIKQKRIKEEKGDAGNVALQVEETVCRIPPGVSSALCKWPVTFRHDVEMSEADGTWKVISFKEERLTPQ
jgi:hypothetical protein